MWSGRAMPGHRTVWSGKSGISIQLTRCRESRSRRSPGGFTRWRRVLVGAGAGGAGVVRSSEARATAAGRNRVGIVDRESGAHEGVDIVDLRARQEADAVAVDVHLDAVRLEDLVLRRGRILEHHPV